MVSALSQLVLLSQLLLPPQHGRLSQPLTQKPCPGPLPQASLASRLLLQAGYDPELRDGDGWTPLHAAAHWGVEDACRLLAEHGGGMDSLTHAVRPGVAWDWRWGGEGPIPPSPLASPPLPHRGSVPVTLLMKTC